MRKLILFLIILVSCGTTKVTQPTLIGKFNWDYWKANAAWSDYEAYDYQPSIEKIQKLKELLEHNEYKFLIFASTSCDECIKHTPRIIKLLKLANYDINKIDIYGMDEFTREPTGDYKNYKVVSVPTLVIIENDKQICKVEYPNLNWLDAMIKCLGK